MITALLTLLGVGVFLLVAVVVCLLLMQAGLNPSTSDAADVTGVNSGAGNNPPTKN